MPKLNFLFALRLERGGHLCPVASLELLQAQRCRLSTSAKSILVHADYGLSRHAITAALVTNEALGLTDGATQTQTHQQGLALGLCLLPHWTAAVVCIACHGKPLGRRVLLATAPVLEHADGPPWQFGIDQDELYADQSLPEGVWGSQKLFLFGLP